MMYPFFKRAFDVVFSFIGLIIFSPVMVITALFIKLEDEGPIFYLGKRVGLNGKEFKTFKFRTMVVNA